jgi:hypothetical protein
MDETPETYTDFMIRAMSGEDEVQSAFLIIRRSNGTIGYRTMNQEMADTIGILRFAQLSVENDLVSGWKD